MLIRAFLVTTFLCLTRAERNISADIEALLVKFRELNGTLDVLDSLEKIGEHAKEIFRLGYPLASVLKQGVNMTDEESEDAKAILELRKVFSTDLYYDSDENTFTMIMYMNSMVFSVHTISEMMRKIGEPSLGMSIRTMSNLMMSGLDLDPMATIKSLDGITRLSCPMPEKQGMKRLARIRDSLRIVENHVYEGQLDSEWNSYKRRHLTPVFMHATDEEVDSLINNITSIDNATHETVIDVFNNWTRSSMDYTHILTSCFLEMANAGCEFNQTAFLRKMGRWHRDIVRSELLKWVVSSITEPDEESYNKDVEIATQLFERTGHFIAKWTRKYQNISWPEMGIEAVKDEIGYSIIPVEAFNETARKVQKIFEESGSQSYAYQVLVVSTSEMDVSWSVGTERVGDYANITNYNGVDIHVFRYDRKESVGRAKVVEREMGYKKGDILKEMKLVSTVNSTETTKNYLAYFQQESASGKLYGKNLCNSVILLKNSVPSGSKEAMIPIGLASFENASYKLETSRTYYPVHKSGTETTNSFKMFFFL